MQINDTGIFGFDVSIYQDDNQTPAQINFVKMKDYGASFVVIKTGQWYYSDEDFMYNWTAAKAAGIPRSSYWFGDFRDSGKAQAQRYWNLLKNDIGEGPHFIDYEGGSWTDWRQLYDFIVEFQKLSNLPNEKIGIYTAYYYWREHCPTEPASLAWFGKYPLWLAWYTDDPTNVQVPAPWISPLLWQSGTPAIGLAAGVESREIDYNVFNGDDARFIQVFGTGSNPNPPPTGEIMKIGTVTTKVLNIREGPGTNFPVIGELYYGDKVIGELDLATNWLNFSKIIRVNGTQVNMNGWSSAQYMSLVEYVPPTTPTLRYTIKVMSDGSLVINDKPYV